MPRGGKRTGAGRRVDLKRRSERAALRVALEQRAAIKADDIIEANREIAQFDPVALVSPDGNYLPLSEIEPAARRCIKRIRVHKLNLTTGDGQTDRVVDYEFFDKHPAIERDYKRLGLQVTHVEMGGAVDLLLRLDAWKQRRLAGD